MSRAPAGLAPLPASLVIFDCDGVLIDSEPVASRVLAETLASAGVRITPEEAHLRFTGCASETVLRICREDYGVSDPQPLLDASRAELFGAFRHSLRAVEGIEALLARLSQRVCVASNSDMERLEASLGLLALRDRFGPHVYSAEMVRRPKPAPDLVLHCLERMGVSAANAVMIDDSVHGIVSARAAGVAAVGFVTPGDVRPGRASALREAGAVAVAASARELAELLGLASLAAAPMPAG